MEHLEAESYYQAINSDNAIEWQATMNEKLKPLSENKTGYLTYLPEDIQAISNKMVWKAVAQK